MSMSRTSFSRSTENRSTLFLLKERLNFRLRLNALNILSFSASNVLKMFLNIIVSIGCTFVIFHLYKPTGIKHKYASLISRYSGRQGSNTILNRQESHITIYKKDFKTKLYMYNTTGDVALTNIRRETKY